MATKYGRGEDLESLLSSIDEMCGRKPTTVPDIEAVPDTTAEKTQPSLDLYGELTLGSLRSRIQSLHAAEADAA